MKKIILLAILLMSVNLYSQSSQQLDNRYGFKHFKFKSDAKNYIDQLEEIDSWNSNKYITSYKYISNDIKQLSGVDIENIELTFYKNELMSIMI